MIVNEGDWVAERRQLAVHKVVHSVMDVWDSHAARLMKGRGIAANGWPAMLVEVY